MKKIGLLFAMALLFTGLSGCGDACEDAADKLKDCLKISGGGNDNGGGECSGQAECLAKCINDASCAELKGEDTSGDYVSCAADCT